MLIAYPQPGKAKSLRLCAAFVDGAKGEVTRDYRIDNEHDAVFYGLIGIEQFFYDTIARAGRDWYLIDNSFFDAQREVCFRVGKNAMQSMSPIPDHKRALEMGLRVSPWQSCGNSVMVIEQSDHFMRYNARFAGGLEEWRSDVLNKLSLVTDRRIIVRKWSPKKVEQSQDFALALRDAHVVVAHSSAAACQALLKGVPVIVTDPMSVCADMSGKWSPRCVENPFRPENREHWVARLAASQWTVGEMKAGVTWRSMKDWT